MRKRGRIDANQTALVAHAKAFGATWLSMANLGEGTPDGIFGFQGISHLVEFKTAKGYLTPHQRLFIRHWQGSKVHILRTTEDVERLLFGVTLDSRTTLVSEA